MRKQILGFVAIAVLAVGCGGGGSKASSTSSSSKSGSSSSSSSAGGGGGGGSFCDTLRRDAAVFDRLGDNATSEQIVAALKDLASKAPSAIKSDVQKIADAVEQFASIDSQISQDPSKASSFASAFSSQEDELTAAEKNVEKFAKDECGIDLNSSSNTDSSSS